MLNCAVIFGNRIQYEHNWGLQAKGWVEGDGMRSGKADPGEIMSVDRISMSIILEPRYCTDEPYVRATLRNQRYLPSI